MIDRVIKRRPGRKPKKPAEGTPGYIVTPERPPKAWGYVRVSKDDDAKAGRASTKLSPKVQKDKIEQYWDFRIKDLGVDMGLTFEDLAVSGAVPLRERPGGLTLIENAKPGDHVIIYYLDRAFRNPMDAQSTMDLLLANNVTLHIVDINCDSRTPTGRMILGIMAYIAAWWRETIRERTKEALQYKVKRGLPAGFVRRIGWKKAHKKSASRWVPDMKHRELIYWCIEQRDCHNLTFGQIAEALLHTGHRETLSQHLRKSPTGRVPDMTVWRWYKAGKLGFPLTNGHREHCFPWEPDLWRSWGIVYTADWDEGGLTPPIT